MKTLRLLAGLVVGVSLASATPAQEKKAPETPAGAKAADQKAPAGKPAPSDWKPLFDGKTLNNWKTLEFGGSGEASVKDGALVIGMGETLSGVVYAGDAKALPTVNYEISLEAQRYDGNDFFVGLTFPYKKAHATLVIGGWGGAVCGISSIDGEDAAHNSTASARLFKNKQWYKIRLRCTEDKLEAWIDNEKIIDEPTENKAIDTRADIDLSKPLGLSTYQTVAHIRDFKIRELTEKEIEAAEKKN